MLDGTVTVTGIDLADHLERVKAGLMDLHQLAERIGEEIRRDNREARLAGLDRDGRPLVSIASKTARDRRRSSGPPLAPDGAASAVVSRFEVDVSADGHGHATVMGGWPTLEWLGFHADGAGRLPVRDILGVRPQALAKVAELVHGHIQDSLNSEQHHVSIL